MWPKAASVPSDRYILKSLWKKAFRLSDYSITSIHSFAVEAAKHMFTCIVGRDRLSATKTEPHLTLIAIKEDLLLTLFAPERIFAFATGSVETDPLAVRRLASCERGLFFTCKLYLVTWRGGTFSMDITSTVRKTQRKITSALRLSHTSTS
jgi:hypothetical protein